MIDVAELASPRQAGWFSPTPFGAVVGPGRRVELPDRQPGLVDVVDIRKRVIVLRKVTR